MNREIFNKEKENLKQAYKDSIVEDYEIWKDRVVQTNDIIAQLEAEGVEPKTYDYDEYGKLCVKVFDEHVDKLLWFDKEVDEYFDHPTIIIDMFRSAQRRAQEEAFVETLRQKLSYEVKKSNEMFFRALWRSSENEIEDEENQS